MAIDLTALRSATNAVVNQKQEAQERDERILALAKINKTVAMICSWSAEDVLTYIQHAEDEEVLQKIQPYLLSSQIEAIMALNEEIDVEAACDAIDADFTDSDDELTEDEAESLDLARFENAPDDEEDEDDEDWDDDFDEEEDTEEDDEWDDEETPTNIQQSTPLPIISDTDDEDEDDEWDDDTVSDSTVTPDADDEDWEEDDEWDDEEEESIPAPKPIVSPVNSAIAPMQKPEMPKVPIVKPQSGAEDRVQKSEVPKVPIVKPQSDAEDRVQNSKLLEKIAMLEKQLSALSVEKTNLDMLCTQQKSHIAELQSANERLKAEIASLKNSLVPSVISKPKSIMAETVTQEDDTDIQEMLPRQQRRTVMHAGSSSDNEDYYIQPSRKAEARVNKPKVQPRLESKNNIPVAQLPQARREPSAAGEIYVDGWSILTYLDKNKGNKEACHIDVVSRYYPKAIILKANGKLFEIHKGYLRK